MDQHLNYRGLRRREKERIRKKFLEIIVKNFPSIRKEEMVNQVQETQSPIQDKHKKKHVETHTNQTSKD